MPEKSDPPAKPISPADLPQAALRELLAWAHLQKYTGVGYVRVNFNQGGATAAGAAIEKRLPPSPSS